MPYINNLCYIDVKLLCFCWQTNKCVLFYGGDIVLLKYSDQVSFSVTDGRIAVFYGGFHLDDQSENIITLKCGDISYRIFGSGLCVAAISKPRCVVSGRIERIELI